MHIAVANLLNPDYPELHSEQKALVDFIVLARAQRFVGFGPSTFSFYLREYRALKVNRLDHSETTA